MIEPCSPGFAVAAFWLTKCWCCFSNQLQCQTAPILYGTLQMARKWNRTHKCISKHIVVVFFYANLCRIKRLAGLPTCPSTGILCLDVPWCAYFSGPKIQPKWQPAICSTSMPHPFGAFGRHFSEDSLAHSLGFGLDQTSKQDSWCSCKHQTKGWLRVQKGYGIDLSNQLPKLARM